MYSQAQKILTLLGISSFVASANKLRHKDDSLQETAKIYTQVSGNGWCTDSVGSSNENAARRFMDANCNDAKTACDSDNACVAYACMTGSSPESVLYTTTGCTISCEHTGWQNDPTLIRRARYTASQPAWSTATCHVAFPVTTTTSTTTSTMTTATTSHGNSINLCHAGFMNSSTAVHSALGTAGGNKQRRLRV